MILVTGANGHIGRDLCKLLKEAHVDVLATDVNSDQADCVERCDLSSEFEVESLFNGLPVQTVIHLASILPTAFNADPLNGARVNLVGTAALLRHAVSNGVRRFVFASSMSVYGSSSANHAVTEDEPAVPDDQIL